MGDHRHRSIAQQIAAFHERYTVDANGCWLWNLATNGADGYGQIQVNGRKTLAHIWAHETFIGPIPDGMQVLHSCDVKRCVNPAHLSAGTGSQNTQDAYDRGRVTGWAPKTTEHDREMARNRQRRSRARRASLNG